MRLGTDPGKVHPIALVTADKGVLHVQKQFLRALAGDIVPAGCDHAAFAAAALTYSTSPNGMTVVLPPALAVMLVRRGRFSNILTACFKASLTCLSF